MKSPNDPDAEDGRNTVLFSINLLPWIYKLIALIKRKAAKDE